MSLPVASFNFQDAGEKAKQFAGGFGGKLIGSIAGILLIITVLRSTFYIVKVGQRGVLMRGGMPVLKRNGRRLHSLSLMSRFVRLYRLADFLEELSEWRKSKQVGSYKVKRPGIWVKFPGWYDVEKVNVQNRVQQLATFNADCPDGQRHINPQFITRVPCDDDGPEFADYPARSIIYSSEADDMFESDGGTALLDILETVTAEERKSKQLLLDKVNELVGEEFDRCGYLLIRVNLRARALTPIEKAIKAFGPTPTPADEAEERSEVETAKVIELPHPIITATSLPDLAQNS